MSSNIFEAACGSCECDDAKFAETVLEGPGSAATRLESLCCCAMKTGSAKYQLLQIFRRGFSLDIKHLFERDVY